jgi:predicted secreted protein
MRWVVLGSAYAILWFLALQILLPIGIKSRDGNAPAAAFGEADPGAPHNPRIGLKILVATIAAGLVWSVFYALVLMKVVDI